MDNMPPLDLATRKKALVQELNGFITAKKDFTQDQAAKSELIGTGVGGTPRSGSSPGVAPRSKDGEHPTVSQEPVQQRSLLHALNWKLFDTPCSGSGPGRRTVRTHPVTDCQLWPVLVADGPGCLLAACGEAGLLAAHVAGAGQR